MIFTSISPSTPSFYSVECKTSAGINTLMVILKVLPLPLPLSLFHTYTHAYTHTQVAIVLLVVVAGAFFVDSRNYLPFMPFGFFGTGMFRVNRVVLFASHKFEVSIIIDRAQ